MSRVDLHMEQLQKSSTEAILVTHREPSLDIQNERARVNFDVEELKLFLNGGQKNIDKRYELAEFMESQPWGKKHNRCFLSREELYQYGLKAALGMWDAVRREGLSIEDGLEMRKLFDLPAGLDLHIGMFIPGILSTGSQEQQDKWLPQCYELSIIGTYAQTELGHGTFLRGLETTATYDVSSQQFIVHSPTLSSTKWWPGALGKTATHAIVMARLFINQKDYGPHAFVMQIRSLTDHRPLQGISIGDIGPKLGYNGVDNGYMRFEHVRVPLDAMLSRFAQVTPDGRYIPPPPANAKANYATMLFVRADIVKNAYYYLSRAVTIAIRYNVVRRQTSDKPGELETQLLDYQNNRGVLLPLLASSYALIFMGQAMTNMYKAFEKDRERSDFSKLPELHALSSGQKALCSWICADGIEASRRCCGGHGFSSLSGLPELYGTYLPTVTYEGDNNVLCLQVARSLLRALVASQNQHNDDLVKGGSLDYFKNVNTIIQSKSGISFPHDCRTPSHLVQALAHNSIHHTVRAYSTFMHYGGDLNKVQGEAWNRSALDLANAGLAHSRYVLHKTFHDKVTEIQDMGALSGDSLRALKDLASLFSIDYILNNLGDFAEDEHAGLYFSREQNEWLRKEHRNLLETIRPNAVGLVDAFAFPDYVLNSCIGRYDGNVYEALLEAAKNSPLNLTEEGPAWNNILKPRLTSKL